MDAHMLHEDWSTYHTPASSRRHRATDHTHSHVTPAPQPLITVNDLASISRTPRQQTHHRTSEVFTLPAHPVAENPPWQCSPSPGSSGDQNSFSLVHPTNPLPTPELDALSHPAFAEAPVAMGSRSVTDLCLTMIQAIAIKIRGRKGSGNNVLGTLRVTFKPSVFKQFFPNRFEELPPVDDSHQVPCYLIHSDYAKHLQCIMELTVDVLNAFLIAAGSP